MSQRRRSVSDERWSVALDHAERGDLRELVRALLVVADVPDWVREDYEARRFSDSDQLLLAVWRAYNKGRRPGEYSDARMKRIVAEWRGLVSLSELRGCVYGTSRAARRLREFL